MNMLRPVGRTSRRPRRRLPHRVERGVVEVQPLVLEERGILRHDDRPLGVVLGVAERPDPRAGPRA